MVDTMDPISTTTGGSLISRMVRAARLDVSLYEEVEADTTATSQSATAVAIVAVAGAIGGALQAAMSDTGGNIIGSVIWGLLSALFIWVVWSYLTYFIGTKMFGGTATPGEMLRTLGFASAPGVFNVLIFIPVLGPLVGFITMIWSLVAGVIAVRQALDFDTGKAILTAVIAGVVAFLPIFILGGIVLAFIAGALSGAS